MPSNNEKYQAHRNDNNNESSESSKKLAKTAAKGAAAYFTGGKGGAVVDKLADTKLGDKVLDRAGKIVDKNPLLKKAAEKLDDSGATDAADKMVSLASDGGKGDAAKAIGGSNSAGGNKIGNHSPIPGSGLMNSSFFKNRGNSILDDDDTDAYEDMEYDSFSSKKQSEGLVNVITFLIKNKQFAIPLLAFAFIFLIFTGFVVVVISFDEKNKKNEINNDGSVVCSTISMNKTSLSRDQFKQKLGEKASMGTGYNTFYQNANTIYNLSVNNNINPEMVVIRAVVEGFSPGQSKNNYWGMGCTNSGGYNACISYSSFSNGVLGYINNISQYETIEKMMSRYAYIGNNWYSPGSSSVGGCYYYPYIKKYMSAERSAQVASACSKSCTGSSCMKTTEEDQKAYTSYQVETMVNRRKDIFGIGEDNCESSGTESASYSDIGSKVAQYAIKTFDSFSYSQSNRMGATAVDCSSLVWRAYRHFNISIGSDNWAPTAGDEYRWCENNGKTIKEENLKPGDLIFWNAGSHYASGHYRGIGHVAMYVGNNQQFAAHTSRYAQPDQVSVTPYYKGSGNLFCRPYK